MLVTSYFSRKILIEYFYTDYLHRSFLTERSDYDTIKSYQALFAADGCCVSIRLVVPSGGASAVGHAADHRHLGEQVRLSRHTDVHRADVRAGGQTC